DPCDVEEARVHGVLGGPRQCAAHVDGAAYDHRQAEAEGGELTRRFRRLLVGEMKGKCAEESRASRAARTSSSISGGRCARLSIACRTAERGTANTLHTRRSETFGIPPFTRRTSWGRKGGPFAASRKMSMSTTSSPIF